GFPLPVGVTHVATSSGEMHLPVAGTFAQVSPELGAAAPPSPAGVVGFLRAFTSCELMRATSAFSQPLKTSVIAAITATMKAWSPPRMQGRAAAWCMPRRASRDHRTLATSILVHPATGLPPVGSSSKSAYNGPDDPRRAVLGRAEPHSSCGGRGLPVHPVGV